MEADQTAHVTHLTECCEVERELTLTEDRCPECGRWSPVTIKRVTIERQASRMADATGDR